MRKTTNALPVCVVLPFYNAKAPLRHAVISVLNQSYPKWQLILLDDGSVDGSADTIRDLVDNASVSLVTGKENRGLTYRLNQMVMLTNAPYIARMDADDLMHPDRLRLQMSMFKENPCLDVVSTGIAIMNGAYRVMGVRSVDRQPTLNDYMMYGGLVHPSCIFRRQFLKKNKYDPRLIRAQDRGIILQGLPDSQYYCVTKPLHFYAEYNCFNKKKYLDSYHSERKMILRHGPRLVGLRATAAYFVISVMKSQVVHLMAALGIAQFITRIKGGSYDGDLSDLQRIVNNVLRTSRDLTC